MAANDSHITARPYLSMRLETHLRAACSEVLHCLLLAHTVLTSHYFKPLGNGWLLPGGRACFLVLRGPSLQACSCALPLSCAGAGRWHI